jgi:prepilin-type N-terminal cleavage/methylation domain-containing protein
LDFHMIGHGQKNDIRYSGFTIVELLIVIVIIAILATLSIVAYNGIQNRAQEAAAISAASQAYHKIRAFAIENNDAYPANLDEAGLSGSDGYEYSVDNSADPKTFCLTATTDTTSYYISNTASTPTSGICSGHTGGEEVTLTCPGGFIVVPGSATYGTSDFCIMKYEAKNVSGVATSQVSGTPWVSISQTSAISTASAACSGCHLMTEAQRLTIAQNAMSVGSNWTGGTVGSGGVFRGHTDSGPAATLAASTDDNGYFGTSQATGEQRRTLTLTNGEVIWDFAGNVWEWTQETVVGAGNQPGAAGSAWREWNALSVAGTLSPNPYPSYADPAASSWTSTQSIGMIQSSSTDATLRAFRGGGGWNSGSAAGIFSLGLSSTPSTTNAIMGFRVAQ